MKQIAEGAGHRIYEHPEHPDKVVKIPKKNHFSYERVKGDIEYCRQMFSRWLPETDVRPDDHTGYRIEQHRIQDIEHISLSHLKCQEIRDELEEILEVCRETWSDDGISIDIIGLEGSVKCFCDRFNKYQGTIADKLFFTPFIKFFLWLKKFKKDLPVPSNALEIWKDRSVKSEITNLALGKNDKNKKQIYLLDLSLVRKKSASIRERIRTFVVRNWNERLLRRRFGIRL